MPKTATRFLCQACAYASPRWLGQCPACGAWNTLVEEAPIASLGIRRSGSVQEAPVVMPLEAVKPLEESRWATGIGELDRVLGGGLMRGSVVLLGGDPGIGKSTLLLQLAERLSDRRLLYVTGEESLEQVRHRAQRLGLAVGDLYVLAETDLERIFAAVEAVQPELVMLDSIQTVYAPELESAPGSIAQVRECAARLVRMAKATGRTVLLVGHVTKEGWVAGPRTLEHVVDAVLQFEGDRQYAYRVLRAIKNRFGSTHEIGIFEMTGSGLREVSNPSALFLAERRTEVSGSAVVAAMEGTRPLLVEVQALVAPTAFGTPTRTSAGLDVRRLAVLLAVLERRAGLSLAYQDVYVNVVGGIRLQEPAVDLAVVAAVASSFRDRPIPAELVLIGEVGLAGELRTASALERRLEEAARLGFRHALVPEPPSGVRIRASGLELLYAGTLVEALELMGCL
ncbi:MAG: DNA repair protein RadA [Bacteroidota bacterium]|nr:DNA repair protein RadA [Bacteroidota bacterium]MDW8138434.1 DNA repair protein RadA [Bacteroidota bacterium]